MAQARIVEKSDQSIKHNLKNIVIIGDGPIALIAAIKFKHMGVDVTVVGPRLNEFYRSGDIDPQVFNKINEFLAPFKIKPSAGSHIKDIERQAYKIAESLKVNFVKKKFHDFSNKRTLVVSDENGESSFIDADIVFDCTGTKRDVLNKFNKYQEEPYFKSQSVYNFEHEAYAHVRMLTALHDYVPENADWDFSDVNSIDYVLAIESLHHLGWQFYHLPFFLQKTLSETKDQLWRKNNAYFEIPEGASNEQIKQILAILVSLTKKMGNQNDSPLVLQNESIKPQKKIVNTLSIKPELTFPNYYIGDDKIPLLIHLGDATANLPFFMGSSMLEGIERLEHVFSSFTILNQTLKSIDLAGIDRANANLKETYSELVSDFVDGVIKPSKKPFSSQKKVRKIYEEAYAECTDPKIKEIIKKGLDRLDAREQAPIIAGMDNSSNSGLTDLGLFKSSNANINNAQPAPQESNPSNDNAASVI